MSIFSNHSLKNTNPSFDAIMDNYLPDKFRDFIEKNFYAKVSEQAKLENLKKDPQFHKDPLKHIALYTDHGVVHVRDVALEVLEVLNTVNGVLIPKRNKDELEFLKAYSLQLVYLHDIGMSDFSSFGRFMHPEFAAQYVFKPGFDEILDHLWSANAGNIPWKLTRLFVNKKEESLKTLYRELLSLSVAHSKSKMPIEEVNHPQRLRGWMLNILSQPIEALYFDQKIARLETQLSKTQEPSTVESIQVAINALIDGKEQYLCNNDSSNHSFLEKYTKPEAEAFEWLSRESDTIRAFIINIQDCLRCVRAADALRQRGTVLRTSAGYEIFIDRKTANAIYALRDKKNEELYLLEGKKSVNAGEANLASSEIDANGNLRVSFHLGAFHKSKIIQKAAMNAAQTIDDIQADVLQSFKRDKTYGKEVFEAPSQSFNEIKILIEATDDNPDFAGLVCKKIEEVNPALSDRIETTISLQGADLEEVRRYAVGEEFKNKIQEADFKAHFYKKLKESGFGFPKKLPTTWANDIKVVKLQGGEELIKSGSPSGFVYIPMSKGLRVYPLGGYESQPASPWVPIGNTGVIRGSVRNAQVIAEKEVECIAIPKRIYLDQWYRPYSPKRLLKTWKSN